MGADLGNIESNTARSGKQVEAHSAKLSAFLPRTWAAADSSQRSGPLYIDVSPANAAAWRWCVLPVALNPTNRFALIVMCEASSARIGSLARMLSSTLRCAGAVALARFRSVWGGDCSERHSWNR